MRRIYSSFSPKIIIWRGSLSGYRSRPVSDTTPAGYTPGRRYPWHSQSCSSCCCCSRWQRRGGSGSCAGAGVGRAIVAETGWPRRQHARFIRRHWLMFRIRGSLAAVQARSRELGIMSTTSVKPLPVMASLRLIFGIPPTTARWYRSMSSDGKSERSAAIRFQVRVEPPPIELADVSPQTPT